MSKKSFLSVLLLCLSLIVTAQPDQSEGKLKHRIVEEGGTGPYKAIMQEEASLPAHTVFVPQDLSPFDSTRPLPVLVWGNGACSNSPWEHYRFLNEIASYGYMVLATGYIPMSDEPYHGEMSTPQQQIESIDWAIAQNEDPTSPYHHKIDLNNICVAGMSCGGLQSLFNCADPRIKTLMICNSGLFKTENAGRAMPGMPMPPKSKLQEIHAPVIYILGGETDIAYENGMDDFHRIQHVPAYAANYPVGHGGTYREPHGGEFTVVARAWLDWQLKGDQEAAQMFVGEKCLLSQRKDWTIEKNSLAADAPLLEFVMQLRVKLGETYNVGDTPQGRRTIVPITGGSFVGPLLRGEILAGGADHQLTDPSGERTMLEAIYSIRTEDNIHIHVRNRGIIHHNKELGENQSPYFKTAPQFEAPADSPYAWLNNCIFICAPAPASGEGITLNVWKVK